MGSQTASTLTPPLPWRVWWCLGGWCQSGSGATGRDSADAWRGGSSLGFDGSSSVPYQPCVAMPTVISPILSRPRCDVPSSLPPMGGKVEARFPWLRARGRALPLATLFFPLPCAAHVIANTLPTPPTGTLHARRDVHLSSPGAAAAGVDSKGTPLEAARRRALPVPVDLGATASGRGPGEVPTSAATAAAAGAPASRSMLDAHTAVGSGESLRRLADPDQRRRQLREPSVTQLTVSQIMAELQRLVPALTPHHAPSGLCVHTCPDSPCVPCPLSSLPSSVSYPNAGWGWSPQCGVPNASTWKRSCRTALLR
jgi:hypothetical protein